MNTPLISDSSTFVDLIQCRAEQQPGLKVFNFIEGHELEALSSTCAQIYDQARRIAVQIAKFAKKGDRVLLLYPPGLEYIEGFFGCLCGAFIAVPVFPPEPHRIEKTLPLVVNTAKNCQANVIILSTCLNSNIGAILDDTPELAGLPRIVTSALNNNADDWRRPDINGDDIAYLQYTSGSTGKPKGVMISHTNILHNSEMIRRRFEHTHKSRGVIWLPPYHDMGLIGGILQPWYVGFPVYLMSYLSFIMRPSRWLKAVTKYQATTSGGPNFAFELLCSQNLSALDMDALDLSSWDLAFVGAEFIQYSTLHRFTEKYADCGFRMNYFYPCYGLAEGTLIATGGNKDELPVILQQTDDPVDGELSQTLVGCGQPFNDQDLAIVDPLIGKLPEGVVGEIWLSGSSVAKGYWNDPGLSQDVFGVSLPGCEDNSFMASGDLGFLKDGELYISGRLKDVIIIRGKNHYPFDIEASVAQLDCPEFRSNGCAAFSADGDRLVLIQEVRSRSRKKLIDNDMTTASRATDIFKQILQIVTRRHQVQLTDIVLVAQAAIPKTANGKISRLKCRQLYQSGSLPVVAKWQESNRRL